MDRLPNELLTIILKQLKDNSYPPGTNNLSSALLVCHKWNDIAMQVLWTDVCINSVTALLVFSTNLSAASECLVESLTILIMPKNLPPRDSGQVLLEDNGVQAAFACDSTKAGWKTLWTLAEKLPSLQNLRTLDKLPPSVEDLELATGGMERPVVLDGANHICPHLAKRSQHLKHVRLCLGMFCPQLFTSSTASKTLVASAVVTEQDVGEPSALRTLVLDTESMEHRTLCPHLTDTSSQPLPTMPKVYSTKRSELASTARAAVQQGQYPKIRSLTIIGSVGGGADRSRAFVVRDVVRGRTILHPWDRANHTTFFMRYKDLSDCDHEYFGSPDSFKAKAEGPAWRETEDGFQFSSEYAVSIHSQTRGYVYKELGVYEGREEYLKRGRLQPGFWWNEGKARRWLLKPLVVEGFEVTRGPKYEKFVVQEDEGGEDSDVIHAGNDD